MNRLRAIRGHARRVALAGTLYWAIQGTHSRNLLDSQANSNQSRCGLHNDSDLRLIKLQVTNVGGSEYYTVVQTRRGKGTSDFAL